MLVAVSALAAAHAAAQEAPPGADPEEPVVEASWLPSEGSAELHTHPHYGLMAAGSILFGVAYLASSITIASLAADQCSSDPGCAHCTSCSMVPVSFVPFVHFLGGADFIGWAVGIPALCIEVTGIILFVVGAALERRDLPPARAGVRVRAGSLELVW